MAVETTKTSENFVGTGVSSSYAPEFYVNTSDQVKVYVDDVLQTIGDDYVVNNVGLSTGCTIVGTFTLGAAVFVERVTPITQLVDTQNNETILEDVLDAEFDKLTMIAQEIGGKADRAILFPRDEAGYVLPAAASRANKVIGFDNAGSPFLVPEGGDASSLRAQLLSSVGSTLVGFIQAGTNPTPRTVQAKLREDISAADFTGFDPTGVNDSTTAVQNALNLASALGGGVVTIPGSARVKLLSAASLTIPAHVVLRGPYLGGVDTNTGGNLDFPWGTMGGTLVLNPGPGRVILCQGSLDGLLLHRVGMTFPVTDAGASYTGEAVHMPGNGASVTNCMFLGFKRGIYSRNFQRLFIYNCKFDCTAAAGDACIDIRQTGDTGLIFKCDAWPYAGGGFPVTTNAGAARAGNFINLYGRNDWTQVVQCQEYGYAIGYDLQNEADDSATVFGPANTRIIQCRSDDGWAGSAPYHTGKIGIRIGTVAATADAFGVIIDGFQSSCAAVSAIYSNLPAGECLMVVNSYAWNGAPFGLVYQKGGDVIIMGGGNDGSGPGLPAAYGNYSFAYDVAGGGGKTFIGGGFRSASVTTCHVRIGVATALVRVDDVVVDTSAPMHDNQARGVRGLASASTLVLPRDIMDGEIILVSGTTTINKITNGRANLTVTLVFSGTLTVTHSTVDSDSMRLSALANFAAADGRSLTLMHTGSLWFEKSRCS